MYNFNEITEDMELAAKAKFREYGVGIKMTAYANGEAAKWEELINTNLYSLGAIRNKMIELARRINTACNDELLGDLTIAFSVTDERDRRITFSWLEMYTFLRAAYKYRKETTEYKTKKTRAESLRAFVAENKTIEEKRTEAAKELALLEAELED